MTVKLLTLYVTNLLISSNIQVHTIERSTPILQLSVTQATANTITIQYIYNKM